MDRGDVVDLLEGLDLLHDIRIHFTGDHGILRILVVHLGNHFGPVHVKQVVQFVRDEVDILVSLRYGLGIDEHRIDFRRHGQCLHVGIIDRAPFRNGTGGPDLLRKCVGFIPVVFDNLDFEQLKCQHYKCNYAAHCHQ